MVTVLQTKFHFFELLKAKSTLFEHGFVHILCIQIAVMLLQLTANSISYITDSRLHKVVRKLLAHPSIPGVFPRHRPSITLKNSTPVLLLCCICMHLYTPLMIVTVSDCSQSDMDNLGYKRIHALWRALEGAFDSYQALLESKWPAKELLGDEDVAGRISRRILQPASGKANDELCQWLYDTYQTQDAELQLVVLRFVPLLCGEYLHRVTTTDQPLAGFEAVLLALYGAETKARGGKPTMINIPRLTHATPFLSPRQRDHLDTPQLLHTVEIAYPALEPQSTVKSTKRADVVGVALDLFCNRISSMPSKAKLDLCHYARSWAVRGCSWHNEVETIAKLAATSVPSSLKQARDDALRRSGDSEVAAPELHECPDPPHLRRAIRGPAKWDVADPSLTNSLIRELDCHGGGMESPTDGPRVALGMEILRPMFKAVGHCLMAPSTTPALRTAAADAAGALYAWASHALVPEAVMASASLVRLSADCSLRSSPPSTAKAHRSAEILVRHARRES